MRTVSLTSANGARANVDRSDREVEDATTTARVDRVRGAGRPGREALRDTGCERRAHRFEPLIRPVDHDEIALG